MELSVDSKTDSVADYSQPKICRLPQSYTSQFQCYTKKPGWKKIPLKLTASQRLNKISIADATKGHYPIDRSETVANQRRSRVDADGADSRRSQPG